MTAFIGEALASLPDAAPLLASYNAALAQAATAAPAPGAAPDVVGKAIEDVTPPAPQPEAETQRVLVLVGGVAALLLAFGWFAGGLRNRSV